MRIAIGLAGLLALAPVAAQTPSTDLKFEVPQDKGPQEVDTLVREFPVGGSSGWHTHPGVEIAYLVSGEMTLEQAGRPTRHLAVGESFMVPRGVIHNGVNVGSVPAKLVITFVVDKGAALRTIVPKP